MARNQLYYFTFNRYPVMKDIHSRINPIVELFARGCALNKIQHYYDGHSHHRRGIDMTFIVDHITTKFFKELKLHFYNFTIRYDGNQIEVVFRIFEDDILPF